jgi:hypothetical protein
MSKPFIKEVTIDMVNKKIGYVIHGIEQFKGVKKQIRITFSDETEKQLVSWAENISVSEI